MKKLLSLLLATIMLLGTCAAMAEGADYKIGILTGTTTQGEEEYRAAKSKEAQYPDIVITDTYPDSFMAEQETTVSKLVQMASDPATRAIIMCQAVPGAKAGFDKIREMGRDDILLIAGVPQEDPVVVSAAADIVLYSDEAGQGDTIMETCADWGVEVFVHYSFPRHMAMEPIVARYNNLAANAEALGIELANVTAPDPTAEAGVTASQQFILEDVPRQMEAYAGKKVAFFTTNCSMQEPLQTAILSQPNAYYPQPCCPSPYHAFPATLGLAAGLEEAGDDVGTLKAIAEKLAEHDAVDRYSTWASPINMSIVDVGYAYAEAYINGEIERNDADALKALFEEKMGGAIISNYVDVDGNEIDNYYTILLQPVNFNDYLPKE